MTEAPELVDEGDAESAALTVDYDDAVATAYDVVAAALAGVLEDPEPDAAQAAVRAAEPWVLEWWQVPYPQGDPVGPAKLPQVLRAAQPWTVGPDVEAYKRAVSRGGRWPWTTFNRSYTKEFAVGRPGGRVPETGVAGFQRQSSLTADGVLGDATYQALRRARVPAGLPNAGGPLLDGVAVRLLEEAGRQPSGDAAAKARTAIADYCRRSIANKSRIHYRQERPMRQLGVAPEKGFTTDCSGHSTSAYFWARQHSGVAVPDPNHRGFDGYGYTGTLINNPNVPGPYQVGDLALYGPSRSNTGHVCTCYQAGDASSSLWCSHGWEGDPSSCRLHYRRDFLCVVRPKLTP